MNSRSMTFCGGADGIGRAVSPTGSVPPPCGSEGLIRAACMGVWCRGEVAAGNAAAHSSSAAAGVRGNCVTIPGLNRRGDLGASLQCLREPNQSKTPALKAAFKAAAAEAPDGRETFPRQGAAGCAGQGHAQLGSRNGASHRAISFAGAAKARSQRPLDRGYRRAARQAVDAPESNARWRHESLRESTDAAIPARAQKLDSHQGCRCA